MDIMKAFTLNGKNTDINIIVDAQECYFQATDVGIALEIKNIRNTLKLVPDSEKVVRQKYGPGGNQGYTFLTIKGLYDCILRSRTSAAKEFKAWVLQVIESIRQTGKYDISEIQQPSKAEECLRFEIEERTIHETLRQSLIYANIHVVYVARIVTEELQNEEESAEIIKMPKADNEAFFKIGDSRDIKLRGGNLKADYKKEIRFWAVIPCARSHDLEQHILKLPQLQEFKYQYKVNGHSRREIFKMKREDGKMLIQLVNDHVKDFQGVSQELEVRNKQLDLDHKNADARDELIRMITSEKNLDLKAKLLNILENITTEKRAEKSIAPNNATVQAQKSTLPVSASTSSIADFVVPEVVELPEKRDTFPCIQQYDANDFSRLIASFNNISDAARKTGFSRTDIKTSIDEREEIDGFRFATVPRDKKDTIVVLEPTVISEKRNSGWVAQMDLDKTKVIAVHQNAKIAAFSLNLKKDGVAYAMRKKEGIKNGYFWTFWNGLNKKQKDSYDGDLADLKKQANSGKAVLQIDKDTGEVVKKWAPITELQNSNLAISHQTIQKYSDSQRIYKGFRWKLE